VAVSAAARRLQPPPVRALPGAPPGRFRVLYADPPWTTFPLRQLPLRGLADDEALLFLWAPAAKLAEALRVMERWGFRYQTCLAWKGEPGRPAGFEPPELLLIGARGLVLAALNGSIEESVRHPGSDAIYKWIEQMCPPGPRASLFAASPPEGWTPLPDSLWGGLQPSE